MVGPGGGELLDVFRSDLAQLRKVRGRLVAKVGAPVGFGPKNGGHSAEQKGDGPSHAAQVATEPVCKAMKICGLHASTTPLRVHYEFLLADSPGTGE